MRIAERRMPTRKKMTATHKVMIACAMLGVAGAIGAAMWRAPARAGATIQVAQGPSITGNCNAVGNNNNLNCTTPPPPELRLIQLPPSLPGTQSNADGTITVRAMFEVIASSPPGQLEVVTNAPGIVAMNVIPQRTGMALFGLSWVRADSALSTVMSPFGQYIVEVKLKAPARVDLQYHFQ
jgi:hypothetical protein